MCILSNNLRFVLTVIELLILVTSKVIYLTYIVFICYEIEIRHNFLLGILH